MEEEGEVQSTESAKAKDDEGLKNVMNESNDEVLPEMMAKDHVEHSNIKPAKDQDSPSVVQANVPGKEQPNLILGVLVVFTAMVAAAYAANWIARIWFDWLVNPWSRKEIPMLFVTLTSNAVIRSSERAGNTVPESTAEGVVGQEDSNNTPRTENESTEAPVSASRQQKQQLFSKEHIKRLREKLFETLCAFRLIVGFPLWHLMVKGLTTLAVSRLSLKENFGFRISLLLSVYCAFRFRPFILHTMIPVFAAYYVWLIGGQVVADVATFPVDILWRLVDLVLLSTVGANGVRNVFLASFVKATSKLHLELFWMLPAPVCFDDYYEAYRSAMPLDGSIPEELHHNHGFLYPTTRGCTEESRNELFHMVFSVRGVLKEVLFVFMVWGFFRLNLHKFVVKWLRERETALDDFQRAIAKREKVLHYARSNPFRAKLHSDPRNFIADSSTEHHARSGAGGGTLAESLHLNIPDLGIKSSFRKLRASFRGSRTLHEQLGERAKSSTHPERVQALRKRLTDFHGEPDTYDYIFRKADVTVRRDPGESEKGVFFQVADQILMYPVKKLKNGLNVTFDGESGVDAGGLSAEMFKLIADELIPSPADPVDDQMENSPLPRKSVATLLKALPDGTVMLSADPAVDLVYYYALGKMVGLATFSDTGFHLPLSSAMLKMMLDLEIDSEDVRALDPTYFENRMLLLLQPGGVKDMKAVMDIEDIPFVWIDNDGQFGSELCSGGSKRFLDEENKLEYVQLLSEQYVCGEMREQIQIFLSGFHEVVPMTMLRDGVADYIDLALLLRGALEIDVLDWQSNTVEPEEMTKQWVTRDPAAGHSVHVSTAELIGWFWECVHEMDGEHRTRLLQFSTGLSGPPVGGFRNLRPRKFNLMIDPVAGHLPSAVTCFATLRVPICATKGELFERFDRICSQRHLTETFGEK